MVSGDGVYLDDELKIFSNEINEKMKEIVNVLNVIYEGKYIFLGLNMGVLFVECIDNVDGLVSLKFNFSLNFNKLNDFLSMDIV